MMLIFHWLDPAHRRNVPSIGFFTKINLANENDLFSVVIFYASLLFQLKIPGNNLSSKKDQ
jgi:hypothetical protein